MDRVVRFSPMPDNDEKQEDGADDFELGRRLNLRDYPSTGLVVIGAVTSGLAWMLYRWLGRKSARTQAGPQQTGAENNTKVQKLD